ncbi:MAG: hypothetical protein ACPGQS_11430 [Bradymonadia bacterium]
MVIFDVGLGFGIGCVFKRYAHKDVRGLVTLACALGVAPAAMAFLSLYPDWDLQYLVPKESVPPWFPGVFCFVITAAGLLGHALQERWSKTIHIFTVVYGAYCLWSLTRITTVTSYTEFHAGASPEIPTSFLIHLVAFGVPAAAIILLSLRGAIRVAKS